MDSNFSALPEDEQTSQLEEPQSISREDCKDSKKSALQRLWENLEKIVSVLVIFYFLSLIVNLIALEQPAIVLGGPREETQRINSLNLEQTLNLRQIAPALDARNQLTAHQNSQNDPRSPFEKWQTEKRLLQRSTNPQGQPEAPPHSLSGPSGLADPAAASEKGPGPLLAAAGAGEAAVGSYREMLAEVSLEEWERSSASKYELFGQIYSQIGENLRKSVRPASAEEREPIIAKYFHQNQRHQYVQELLRENYELSAERSKTDALYLELMAEEYDLAKEEPSFICALLATHNNAFHGQVARTLNSIFNQQYKQYQLVVADAGSSDETLQKIQEYLGRNAEFRERTQVVEVEGSSQALAVLSAAKRCREDSLVVLLDGNTELIGKEVFSIIDSEQRAGKPVVLYSDHYTLDVSAGSLSLFRAQKYDESENFMAIYRSAGAKYGRIVVSKSATLQNIPASHIQHNGRYFEYSGLYSIAASLLELSCGRVKAIAEPLALAVQDSAIAEAEREERRHELALIAMKSKFDVC